ncbi:MAG: PrpF domain-containing protein [Pseudomonadota bacterium]
MSQLQALPNAARCMIIRGGTSKGVYLNEDALPSEPTARQQALLAIFGSPDKRQIDGLGGADPLTSKTCIIGPPPAVEARERGAELTYTFGQVEIDTPSVDFRSLCGNLTAGVGAYALWQGLVEPVAPVTTVRIYNTNLRRMLTCEVPVRDGEPLERGDYVIPGVPGSGAKILVDFADTAGAATGALLPTGKPREELDVPGIGALEVSLVDTGNAHVFVRAADLGLAGTETVEAIDGNPELRACLERIRALGGARMGMIRNPAASASESPATPLIAMVAPPADYRIGNGPEQVRADQCDFVARLMFMQQMHKAYAGTSTVCTGVASRIPGTLVHEVCRGTDETCAEVRIGHPAGVIETESRVTNTATGLVVERATLGRTARRIMSGTVYF